MRGGFGGKRFVRGRVCGGWGVLQKAHVFVSGGFGEVVEFHKRVINIRSFVKSE